MFLTRKDLPVWPLLGQITHFHLSSDRHHQRAVQNMIPFQEEVTMEICLETKVETRKEWITPELKKIDLEQLTAAGTSGDDDLAAAFS